MTVRLSEACGQQLLDWLMNDPNQQDAMNHWVKTQMTKFGVTEEEASVEDSHAYNLYYALTTEWHTKVLAAALQHLTLE